MNDDNEIWKIITGYTRYFISNLSRIKKNEYKKIMKATLDNNYYRINLISENRRKKCS